jgi:hypothetical protein
MILRTLADLHGVSPYLRGRRLRLRVWNNSKQAVYVLAVAVTVASIAVVSL